MNTYTVRNQESLPIDKPARVVVSGNPAWTAHQRECIAALQRRWARHLDADSRKPHSVDR